jgi:hypothetical protein
MMLNCRPHDLAIVVRPCYITSASTGERVPIVPAGTIVGLTHLVSTQPEPMWGLYRPQGFSVHIDNHQVSGYVQDLADSILRPLRDTPGPDESLAWTRPGETRTRPVGAR